jgi:hypothetical protein
MSDIAEVSKPRSYLRAVKLYSTGFSSPKHWLNVNDLSNIEFPSINELSGAQR